MSKESDEILLLSLIFKGDGQMCAWKREEKSRLVRSVTGLLKRQQERHVMKLLRKL